MAEEGRRILVVQDASWNVSPSAIRGALQRFSLKPGDAVTLLVVIHQFSNPMGFKIKVDKANQKIIQDELEKKKEEYLKNAEIMELQEQYEAGKVNFDILLQVEPCEKRIVVSTAKDWAATWLVLDRQMSKHQRLFMEMLSCGISRMKRDNGLETLQIPKGKGKASNTSSTLGPVTYDEMVLGSSEEEQSHNKSPSDQKTIIDKGKLSSQPFGDGASSSNSSSRPCEQENPVGFPTLENSEASSSVLSGVKSSPLHYQEGGNTTNGEKETAGGRSTLSIAKNQKTGPEAASNAGQQADDEFPNSICSICKNRRPKIERHRDFTYSQLHTATKGFSKQNFLSEGGFGSVYRGEWNGLKIAVKQLKETSLQGEKEFKVEVQVLSKVIHKNVVGLLGSCSEGRHRLLVYEYVCNGSLDKHLPVYSRNPLSWEKRIRIALGAAKGLRHLHENKIIHRDIRPNNILITHDHEALLGDFGLARNQSGDHSNFSETDVVGTLGYLAPEYAESGKVSTKTDVYAFGVVLLQLMTGRRTTDKRLRGRSLVGWARPLLKDKNYPDLIDERIMNSHNVHQLFWMVRIAEKCLAKDPNARLKMDKVVEALQTIVDSNPSCGPQQSPAQSDSVGSIPGTDDEECSAAESSESPSESGSSGKEITSITTVTQRRFPHPPSPPARFGISALRMPISHEMSPLGIKNRYESEKEASHTTSRLHYTEMVS